MYNVYSILRITLILTKNSLWFSKFRINIVLGVIQVDGFKFIKACNYSTIDFYNNYLIFLPTHQLYIINNQDLI